MTQDVNDNLILISGKASSGKSASFMDLKDPEGVIYANCEAGKKLPFPAKFKIATITDPFRVFDLFEYAEQHSDSFHTIIIDSGTYLMDMFESLYIVGSADGRQAWGEYAQYWKKLLQQYVARSSKNVIVTGHTADILNESEHVMETMVKVKGSLMNQGVESYFSNVISTKRVSLDRLEDFKNPLLNITPDDEINGFKYCFQTRLTKETVNERIRAPLRMWKPEETYIDNNVQFALDRLKAYYA